MASEVRARMVDGAVQLLAQKGLQATSFTEVLDLTGAPRGSVYHHFPGGKDQLVGEAVGQAGDRALELLDRVDGAAAEEVAAFFIGMWRTLLVRSDFGAGCAVAAVTVATDSLELLDRAASVFRTWRHRLAQLLEKGGVDPHHAPGAAVLLIASCEGAVVLSRAERSMEPFDLASWQLQTWIGSIAGGT